MTALFVTPTVTVAELPSAERQLLAGYQHFRFALAGGNPSTIVAAEAAFLELAQSVCDMARTPAPRSAVPLVGHEQERGMEERKDQEERPSGTSPQGDGDHGADEQQDPQTDAEEHQTVRDASSSTQGFRVTEEQQ